MESIVEFKEWLDATDARLWPVLLALIVTGAIALWRRVHPASFERLPPKAKAFPAILLAMAVSGATNIADQSLDVLRLVIESFTAGVLATGGYEMTERLRHGSKKDRAVKKALKRGGTDAVLLEEETGGNHERHPEL